MVISPDRVARWSEARRILAVRLDGMGDVLMTTPAIRALKDSGPDREVTLWTSMAGAAAARLVPEIDAVVEYDAPWMKASSGAAANGEIIQVLADGQFDGAVIFSLHTQSALPAAVVCTFAGIPLRLARSREKPYQLLTDWIPEDENGLPQHHDVRRQLELCRHIGATTTNERLSLRVSADARLAAMQRLALSGIDPKGAWAVVHPGATAASRRYPVESFAAACLELAERGWQFVITGSGAEADLCSQLAGQVGPAARTLGPVSLEELAAVIGLSPVIITNNTGPAHIAAAVGTPVVDIYALTNPQHTPWQVPNRTLSHSVPCKFCYRSICPELHNACIRMITPREVAEAALELTNQPPTPGRQGEALYA